MALFDTLFSQPTREERERQQREAYKDLLRGTPQQAGPPQPTLGDIAGREYYQPGPEPPGPGITGPGGAAFGIYPSSGRQERTMPPVPDIPIPVIEQDTRPFGDIPAPAAAAPTAAPGRGKALPRATGAGGGAGGGAAAAGGAATAAGGAAPAGAAAAPVDDLEAQHKAALAAQEALLTPPDRAAAEEGYKKQALGGQRQLALALMAGEAGLQPFQAQHLKQAAAARDPLKMAGGTMTETGFIEDPAYQQELKLKRADMRVKSIERAQELAASAAERARLAKEKIAADRELKQMVIDSNKFIAGMMEAGRAERAGAGGKGKGGISEASPQDMLNVIGEARLHLGKATGSGIGSAIDKLAAGVGYAPKGALATARLEPVAAKLTMMQPRMEGPQSDADRKLYESAAGRVADDTLPTERRMAALDVMESMARKYQSGYWEPPGGKGKAGGRRATDQGGGEVDFSALPP
jgi:hypothetical protein